MKVLIKRGVNDDTQRFCKSLGSRALQILAVDECGIDVDWKKFSSNANLFCNSTFNQSESTFDKALKLFCNEYRQEHDPTFWEKTKEEVKHLTEDLSIINVYFKDLGIVKYSKDENYGLMDVIGECY